MILFEVIGVAILWWYGTGWIPYIIAVVCVVNGQVHITSYYRDISLSIKVRIFYVAHDTGHIVFKNWHFLKNIYWGFCLGLSAGWWKFRHDQHHAKPNVVSIIMTDHDRIH